MKKAINILALLVTLGTATHCAQRNAFYSNVLRSDIFYQAYDNHQYDFLYVIDNSASMKDKVAYMRDNLQGFMNILNSRKAVDFQMAVVTTDMFTYSGALVAAPSGQTVVKSSVSTNPAAEFAAIVNNVTYDTATSFWEQGLESAYQAVYKYGTSFVRPGVDLNVIIISDEDDYSCKDHCWGVEPEHNPDWVPFTLDRYMAYFGNMKKAENANTNLFPIVGLPTSTCPITTMGARYTKVMQSLHTNGVMGSVCSSEFAASYNAIASTLADRGVKFPLSQAASGNGINVYVDGHLVKFSPDNYVYDQPSNSIIFTGAVPSKGSTIQVTYNQNTN